MSRVAAAPLSIDPRPLAFAPTSFTNMSAIWLSLFWSISCTSSATVADSIAASSDPSTAVGRVRDRARDRHALRGEGSAEAVGVRERGIGEEGRVARPRLRSTISADSGPV